MLGSTGAPDRDVADGEKSEGQDKFADRATLASFCLASGSPQPDDGPLAQLLIAGCFKAFTPLCRNKSGCR
ncbi:MAG: hypothetical protein CMJ85_08360 [Planctomycetes bacterium]|nr:hypothetical protein [Planctomycetota bacterium]